MTVGLVSKKDAIRKHSCYVKKNKDMKLYCEDVDNTGKKTYFTMTPTNLYNRIINKNQRHFYEFFTENNSIIFALDIDISCDDVKNKKESINIVKENITKVKSSCEEHYKTKVNISNIVVLESLSEISVLESNKFSYHVIFRDIVCENNLVCKDIYNKVNEEYTLKYCDPSIYNLTCLRLCFCKKKGKEAFLSPISLKIYGENTLNNSIKSYDFFLKTMITYIFPEERNNIIKKTSMKKKIKEIKLDFEKTDFKENLDKINFKEILDSFPEEVYDDYHSWIKIGLIFYNLSTKVEESEYNFFEMWDEWSKKSKKYKNGETKKLWKNFKDKGKNYNSIGMLINMCKSYSINSVFKKKNSLKNIVSDYPIKEIELERSEEDLVINKEKLNKETFDQCIDNKVIFLQSEKGTGKTSNLFKCLFENKMLNDKTSVLFISSRRTFGVKLHGDLQDYDFKLYSECKEQEIDENKVICQIDSLTRLVKDYYDYVIIDECESLARYLTSQHFTKNPKANSTITQLEFYIENANKIIAMDADLSIRTQDYIKQLVGCDKTNSKLIVNTYLPFKKYNIVVSNYINWISNIVKLVKENKRLVIAMASNQKAKDIKTVLNDEFKDKKILIIHKETKDEDKIKLSSVNTDWINYDIVIYTPTVCMGVSFDIPNHFDYICAYGCEKSLGAQEFCQMIHRVREPKNKDIFLSLDNFKEYNEEEDFISYDDMENMLCCDYYKTHYELHNNLIVSKYKNEIDEDSGTIKRVLYYPYKDEPIYKIFVRNGIENTENRLNFSSVFFGYVKNKGYNISFLGFKDDYMKIKDLIVNTRNKRINEEKEVSASSILEAKDITEKEFHNLIMKNPEMLEDDELSQINRYRLKSCYGIEEGCDLSHDFIIEYNDRNLMSQYKNLSMIVDNNIQNTEQKISLLKENKKKEEKYQRSCFVDFLHKASYLSHSYCINIINKAGFDINNKGIILDNEKMNCNLNEAIKYIDKNKKDISFRLPVNYHNKDFTKELTLRTKLDYVNNIIHGLYGIKIAKIDKNKKTYGLIGFETWNNIPRKNNEIKLIPKEIFSKKEDADFCMYENFNIDLENDKGDNYIGIDD